MKKIDLEGWKRKETYNNFIKYTNPAFSLGTRLDVTALLEFCRENNRKFFPSFMYIVTRCANEVEELRLRISGKDVVLYDSINPKYIVILEDESLVTCGFDYTESYDEFYELAERTTESVKKRGVPSFNEEIMPDCYFFSCLPWTDFSYIENPYDFNDATSSSIPRIVWGKYVTMPYGRCEIAINVSAHHGLCDGRHVARFFEKMQNALDNINDYLRT